jgi:DNA-binding transcriptional LysR family regulator
MDKFAGLAAFVRTAETESFVAAGRALGVSASAVGKSVARLEQRMGVRLFHRSTRRVRLTEEARQFYERCRRIIDDFDDAEAMLAHAIESPRGKLRVSAAAMGYRLLMPILPAFMRRYPEIELDLDFDDRIADVIDEGLDAVIRSGEPPDSSLIARRVGSFGAKLYASPDYLRRHGVPEHPGDLERHACLQFRNRTSGKLQKWMMNIDPGKSEPRLPASLVCNNIEAILTAAINGLGVSYMPSFVARDAIKGGVLLPLLDSYMTQRHTFWMLWPSNRQMPPKLRVFVDFVCKRMFAGEND